jgi:hypothetical protein
MHESASRSVRTPMTFEASMAPSGMRAMSSRYGVRSSSPPMTLSTALVVLGWPNSL